MISILIVEDEPKISRFLSLELEHEGYSVETSADGREGLEKALQKEYDCLILDIMLPGLSGIEILRRYRATKQTPVLILTARDAVTDKVLGLDFGADDYMTKPFAIEELLARLRTLLKRSADTSDKHETERNVGKLRLILGKHAVSYDNEPIELTRKEYDLLLCLVENVDRVLSRKEILDLVWGYDFYGDTNIVDVYIRYLRSKIDDRFGIKLIETLRGSGYIIKA